MSCLPLSARLRSPLVSVSSILVTTMSSVIAVRALVGPRPVYSRVHCTIAVEISAETDCLIASIEDVLSCPRDWVPHASAVARATQGQSGAQHSVVHAAQSGYTASPDAVPVAGLHTKQYSRGFVVAT